MKAQFIILWSGLFLLFGCGKESSNELPPSPMKESLITWHWEKEVHDWELGYHNNPVLYKDWILISDIDHTFSDSDLYLTAFDKNTGEVVWKWYPSGRVQVRPINMKRKDHYLIINTDDGLICLDLETQTMVWEYEYGSLEVGRYAFDIYDDYLYISNPYKSNGSGLPYIDSTNMIRFNIYDGGKEHVYGKAKVDKKSPSFHAALKLEDKEQVVFVTSYLSPGYSPYDQKVLPDIICYDMKEKKVIWEDTSFCKIYSSYHFSPLEFEETIIAVGDWSLYCYNKNDGTLLWRHEFEHSAPFGGFNNSSPILYDGIIYCIDDTGIVYAVDASSGLRRWTNILPGEVGQIRFGPAPHAQDQLLIEDGILWVNSWGDRDMILFDIRTGKELERLNDDEYSGNDILYDVETGRYFVTTYDSVKSFSLKK